MPEEKPRIAVFITLGGGVGLGIQDGDEHLVVVDYTGYRIDLGKFTMKRMADINACFERLRVHAISS